MLPPDKQDKAEVKGKGGSGAKDFLIFVLIVVALALGATAALFYLTPPEEVVKIERVKERVPINKYTVKTVVVEREVTVKPEVIVETVVSDVHVQVTKIQTVVVKVPVEVTVEVDRYHYYREPEEWTKKDNLPCYKSSNYKVHPLDYYNEERFLAEGEYEVKLCNCPSGYTSGSLYIDYEDSSLRKMIDMDIHDAPRRFTVEGDMPDIVYRNEFWRNNLKHNGRTPAGWIHFETRGCWFEIERLGD